MTLTLSGCLDYAGSYEVVGGPETDDSVSDGGADQSRSATVQVKELVGHDRPDSLSIVCVEGSAFLYVFEGDSNAGGPSIARLPEQDGVCTN